MNASVEWVLKLADRVSAPAQRIERQLSLIERMFGRIDRAAAISGGAFGGVAAQAERAAARTTRAWERVNGTISGTRQRLQGAATAALGIGAAAFGAGMLGKSIVDAASYKQDQLTSLGQMLKSNTKAAALFNQAQKFAAATPFTTQEVLAATKQTIGAGFTDRQAIPVIKLAGSLASGNNVPIEQAIRAFAALKGGDFGQAFGVGQGFNQLGISREQLVKAGLKFDRQGSYQGNSTQGLAAVRKITEDRFGKSMELQGKNLSGLGSTLKSRPFELFSSLVDDQGNSKALAPVQKLMSNLAALTDFDNTSGPGGRIKNRFQSSMTALFGAIFNPLAGATGGSAGENLVNGLLDKVDQFSAWWSRNGPMIIANAKGIWQGLTAAFSLAGPLLGLLGKMGKVDDGKDPKDALPGAVKGLLDGGLLGKAIGFVGGLKLGLAGLDAVTFGASSQILAFAGPKVLGLLSNVALTATKRILATNFAMEILTNPAGKLAGLALATRGLWAQTAAVTALGVASLKTKALEILTNPAGRMAGVRAAFGLGGSAAAGAAGGAAGGVLGRMGAMFARLGPLIGRILTPLLMVGRVLLGLLTGPIGLIVLGITAIVAGGIALYNSWKPFHDLIDGIAANFSEGGKIYDFFGRGNQAVQTFSSGLENKIVGAFGGATGTTGQQASVAALAGVAGKLGIDPQALLAVAFKESTLNAGATYKRKDGSIGAEGLIQFTNSTAAQYGLGVGAMSKMTPDQQAPYIERYLRDHGVKAGMGTEQIYAAVFGGNANRSGTLYAQGSDAYSQNTGLDTNKDGKITSAEAAQEAARAFGNSGITLTQNFTVMGSVDPAAVAAIGQVGQNGLLLAQGNLNTEAGGGARRP